MKKKLLSLLLCGVLSIAPLAAIPSPDTGLALANEPDITSNLVVSWSDEL